MAIPTRRSLLSRLRNLEDNDSWSDFFETYWKLIFNVARKAGLTPSEAEEVVQETVIQAAKKMPGFRYDPKTGSFKSWLLHTAQWKISDQFRKRMKDCEPLHREAGSERRTTMAESVPDPNGPDVEKHWNEEWCRNLEDAARQRTKRTVNPKHYQIFDLYVVKKLPIKTVMARLGVGRNAIYIAKCRIARKIIEEIKRLEREGY